MKILKFIFKALGFVAMFFLAVLAESDDGKNEQSAQEKLHKDTNDGYYD